MRRRADGFTAYAVLLFMAGLPGCSEEQAKPEPIVRYFEPNAEGVLEYPFQGTQPRDLYLDLVKLSLLDLVYENRQDSRKALLEGRTWPTRALTMIGLKRLDNIESCMNDALAEGVPGDFIEAGAWRGGATIFMRAVLKAHGVTDRTVWVADSFEGLPPPDPDRYPADEGSQLYEKEVLAVTKEAVERNFSRYGLLDEQVKFRKGWFKDTLAQAPIESLAMLRLDGDLYESTMDALVPLYPKLSPGGCLIVDDFYAVDGSAEAVRDYRKEHGITTPMRRIDFTGVYWKKE
jgi:hypothetical protein